MKMLLRIIVFAQLLCVSPHIAHCQNQILHLNFDGKGVLTNSLPDHLLTDTISLRIRVDFQDPFLREEIRIFTQSLEDAIFNLQGKKYYDWEALFKAYGFEEGDRKKVEKGIRNTIVYLNKLLVTGSRNSTTCQNCITENFSLDSLYYLQIIQEDSTIYCPLALNNRNFEATTNVFARNGKEVNVRLYRKNLQLHFVQSITNDLTRGSIDALDYKDLEKVYAFKHKIDSIDKGTFSVNNCMILKNAWKGIYFFVEYAGLSKRKALLEKLLWLSQGKPTINVFKNGEVNYEKGDSVEEKKEKEEKEQTQNEKLRKLKSAYWLSDVKFYLSRKKDSMTWMRNHDYQQQLQMAPSQDRKNDYIEGQNVVVLTHNAPPNTRVTMKEAVEVFVEKGIFETTVSEPLATILGLLDSNSSAVGRFALVPEGEINYNNYKEIYEAIEYAYDCLIKEFAFDFNLLNNFPEDDTCDYSTIVLNPQTSKPAPIKIAYTLNVKGQKEGDTVTLTEEYRRNKLRIVEPSVLIGGTSVQQTTYTLTNGQIEASVSSGITYVGGLNVHLAKFNLSNPNLVFSKRGKSYDYQSNFNLSRLSMFLGASLTNPLKDFYLGPNLDLIPGLGITAGVNLYIQEVQKQNGASLIAFDHQMKTGYFASISITPAIFKQIFPGKIFPLFARKTAGKVSNNPNAKGGAGSPPPIAN